MKLTLTVPILTSLFLNFGVVHAVPRPQDVYVPPVLKPQHGDTWVVGEKRVVEW
jgi:hypothetical protein